MHPCDAQTLARQLMREHGLSDWTFRFDHAKRRFGSCRYGQRLITLSRPLTLMNAAPEVRDTILHEIAHALAPGDGHGPRWRAACVRIGARPLRCYTDQTVVSPPRKAAPYRFGCKPCGWWVDRRRVSTRRYVCKKCRGDLLYEEKASGRFFEVRNRKVVAK